MAQSQPGQPSEALRQKPWRLREPRDFSSSKERREAAQQGSGHSPPGGLGQTGQLSAHHGTPVPTLGEKDKLSHATPKRSSRTNSESVKW